MTFADFFRSTTGTPAPYAYQCRLAAGDDADPTGQFTHGADCASRLVSIPTGLGKTAAVTIAWLWNHPRRSSAICR